MDDGRKEKLSGEVLESIVAAVVQDFRKKKNPSNSREIYVIGGNQEDRIYLLKTLSQRENLLPNVSAFENLPLHPNESDDCGEENGSDFYIVDLDKYKSKPNDRFKIPYQLIL